MLMAVLLMIPTILILGPGAGAVLALSSGFSTAEAILAVSLIHVGLVPVWFGIFELLRYTIRYERRVLRKFLRYGKIERSLRSASRANLIEFERRVGQLGLGLGTAVFTFIFGISWAALVALALNVKRRTIFISIALGALASGIFWSAAFAGLGVLVPNLWAMYILGFVVTLWFMTYSRRKERRVIQEMSRTLRKIGADRS
ncbi:MAG: hypothetical protein QW567_02480 [Candidatus Hadarchaeales archaeon]